VKKPATKTKSPKLKSSQGGLNVKSGVKGGRIALNHGKAGLTVKSGVKGGRLAVNHSRAGL
jgi:hypothetical protein